MHGFIYHCFDNGGLDLHPCCTMNLSEHDHRNDHDDMTPDDV
jgi:hypothetical protein